LANVQEHKVPDGAATGPLAFDPQRFKAQEIEMELIGLYGDDVLQISAGKKWRTHFLQGRTELGDEPGSGRPAHSDLIQLIAELIRERLVLSSKVQTRHLRVSKDTCLRFLHKKLGLKKLSFDGFHTSSRRIRI
jgi:hypothetical protein